MNKLITAFLLTIFCSFSVLGQTYEQCVELTQELMSFRKIEADSCVRKRWALIEELPSCYMDFLQTISERSCFPAMRATFKVQHFLWQQQYVLAKSYSQGEIDGNQFKNQWDRGMELIQAEVKSGAGSMMRELGSISRSQAEAYAASRVNNAIVALGWISQQRIVRPENPFKTYIINGRTINCADLGAVIQCN